MSWIESGRALQGGPYGGLQKDLQEISGHWGEGWAGGWRWEVHASWVGGQARLGRMSLNWLAQDGGVVVPGLFPSPTSPRSPLPAEGEHVTEAQPTRVLPAATQGPASGHSEHRTQVGEGQGDACPRCAGPRGRAQGKRGREAWPLVGERLGRSLSPPGPRSCFRPGVPGGLLLQGGSGAWLSTCCDLRPDSCCSSSSSLSPLPRIRGREQAGGRP